MKLFLLLLAIYSLIFYQSYKIERLKGSALRARQVEPAKKYFSPAADDRAYENAVYRYTGTDRLVRLRPVFY
jgi:hypothetical protein